MPKKMPNKQWIKAFADEVWYKLNLCGPADGLSIRHLPDKGHYKIRIVWPRDCVGEDLAEFSVDVDAFSRNPQQAMDLMVARIKTLINRV